MFIYPYEELFGSESPKLDIMLRSRDGRKLTFFQHMFLPDGLRQCDVSHIMMNFAYEVKSALGIDAVQHSCKINRFSRLAL
jgi:hypothetical protein